MSAYEEKTPSLEWKPLPDDLTTSLPFEAALAVVDDEGQPLTELREQVSVSAITSKVCLAEGFEKESMGLWSPAFLPGHYEHGFDTEVCAPEKSWPKKLKVGTKWEIRFGSHLACCAKIGSLFDFRFPIFVPISVSDAFLASILVFSCEQR